MLKFMLVALVELVAVAKMLMVAPAGGWREKR